MMKCFVISPIGDEQTAIRVTADHLLNNMIRAALAPIGYEANRVDNLHASWISTQIIAEIKDADLVVVVLTELDAGKRNANVYWELGIANQLCKKIIPIAEIGTKLPADVQDQNTIFYAAAAPGAMLAGAGLANAISQIETRAKAMETSTPRTPFEDVLKEASGKFALHAVYHGKLWVLDLFHTGVFDTQREMERDNKLSGIKRTPDPKALERIGSLLKRHVIYYSQQCNALHEVARKAPAPVKYKDDCLALCAPMITVGDEACRLADWLEEDGKADRLVLTDIDETRRLLQNLLHEIEATRAQVNERLKL